VTEAGALEVTETIEHLDGEWPCHVKTCKSPARWQVVAHPCKCIMLACPGHKILLQDWMASDTSVRACAVCRELADPKLTEFIPL
jgi:hypothetical protein